MAEFGPTNGVMGDMEELDLPVTSIDEVDLSAEKKAAKFSRTAEFARLKAHFDARINYYQNFLPNGDALLTKEPDLAKMGEQWLVANAVIAELRAIVGFYEEAQEIVKNAAQRSDD